MLFNREDSVERGNFLPAKVSSSRYYFSGYLAFAAYKCEFWCMQILLFQPKCAKISVYTVLLIKP